MLNKESEDLTINEAIFRDVQQYMREHPEEFDMTYGFRGSSTCALVKRYKKKVSLCNTTMCIAGTAVWLADAEFRKTLVEKAVMQLILLTKTMSHDSLSKDISIEVAWNDIDVRARELLGLTTNQAEYLFQFHKHHYTFFGEKGYGFLKYDFEGFLTDFAMARNNFERVEIACQVIDKFLEVQGEIFDWREGGVE